MLSVKNRLFFFKPFLLDIYLDICYSLNSQTILSIVLVQDILEKLKVDNSSSRHPNGPKMFVFIHKHIQFVFIYIFIYIQLVFISIISLPDILLFVLYFFQTLNFLLCIGVQRINNAVVVSGEQEREPAIHVHVSILSSHPLLPHPGQHITLSTVRWAIQWVFGYPFLI